MDKEKYTYEDLLKIVSRLRGKDGCPWDRKQTHESLKGCMLEEAYETVEAINKNDDDNLKEELGDVLLQVVMHSQIAGEEERFDMSDVVHCIAEKMIRRHPHIFGNTSAGSADDVADRWEDIKKREKQESSVYEGLCRIPKAMPANMRAQKVLKKAALGGYNYGDFPAVLLKVENDLDELKQAISQSCQENISHRLGVLMFDVMNLSRFLDVNAENSLTNVIEKFINRLGSVENLENTGDLGLSGLPPQLLGALWDL